jgi:hypothetical protein
LRIKGNKKNRDNIIEVFGRVGCAAVRYERLKSAGFKRGVLGLKTEVNSFRNFDCRLTIEVKTRA